MGIFLKLALMLTLLLGLGACFSNGYDFESELWGRGAENATSSPCAGRTCFGD